MFCTTCGSENSPDSKFCARCGAQLNAAQLNPTPAGGARAPRADTTSIFTAVPAPTPATDAEPAFSPSAHQGAVDSLPPGSALLVVKRGPNAGSRFLLDRDLTTAGRHPDSDIFLDDVTVSRRHVDFRREPNGGFSVHDVGSLNGTYVNRQRIDSAVLAGSDEVQIGKFRLVFLTSDSSAIAE